MKKALIATTALLIAGTFITFGWHTYPAFSGDAPVFIPTAIQLAAGEDWANDIHPFLYPAPLFPMVVSWLMPAPTPQDAFFTLSIFSAVNVLLCGLVFYRVAVWGGSPLTWYDALLVVGSLGGMATWLVPGSGRPEAFASLLVLTGVVAFLYWKKRWRTGWLWVLLGVLLGLMMASSPNGTVLFALLILMFCSLLYQGRQWWRRVGAVLGVPSVALGIVLLLYPARVAGMLSGVLATGYHLLTPAYLVSPRYSIFYYYVTEPQAFCYGFVLLFSLGGSMHLLYREWEKVASPRRVLFFLTLFLCFAYYTAIRQPNRRYNLLLFASVFFALGIYYVSFLERSGLMRARVTGGAYVVLAMIAAAGFLRNVAVFPIYLRHGTSLKQARAQFEQLGILQGEETEVLAVGPTMWALSEQYGSMRYCTHPERCGEGIKWFIAQQQFSGRKEPRSRIGDYGLKRDFFVPVTPRLFGIKLANSMHGYSFAVYQKGIDGNQIDLVPR